MNWLTQELIDIAISLLVAGTGAGVIYVLKKVMSIINVKRGVTALLRDRIVESYNHYADKGYCPIYARENIQALFDEYKALGGNGAVENLVGKLKALPTKPE